MCDGMCDVRGQGGQGGPGPAVGAAGSLPDLLLVLQQLTLVLEDVSARSGPFAHASVPALQVRCAGGAWSTMGTQVEVMQSW